MTSLLPEPFPHSMRLLLEQLVRASTSFGVVDAAAGCLRGLRFCGRCGSWKIFTAEPVECVWSRSLLMTLGFTPFVERLLSLPTEGANPQPLTRLLCPTCADGLFYQSALLPTEEAAGSPYYS